MMNSNIIDLLQKLAENTRHDEHDNLGAIQEDLTNVIMSVQQLSGDESDDILDLLTLMQHTLHDQT